MKILFFGDIVGKVGRAAVKKALPEIVKAHNPDVIIANAENLAHGTGITPKTVAELQNAGINIFTSGNHVWDKPNGEELLQDFNPIVIRPYNYGSRKSGKGYKEISVGDQKLLVINLQGQVFMKDEVDNPFTALDQILTEHPPKNYDAIFLDLHAEASSEKVAMGWHGDGRISAMVGTHTHVPTADARILPEGTGYITDVGMTGAYNSVIGVEKESILEMFVSGEKKRKEYAEEGTAILNAAIFEIKDRKTTSVEQIQQLVEV